MIRVLLSWGDSEKVKQAYNRTERLKGSITNSMLNATRINLPRDINYKHFQVRRNGVKMMQLPWWYYW